MRCSKCKGEAVSSWPKLCKNHFIQWFEQKFYSTIKKYGLIKKDDKILCAASGGKDSTAMLYLINKKYANVTALAVNEGIAGYRQRTLADLSKFCKLQGIPLKIVSFSEEFAFTLDSIGTHLGSHCLHCGVLRRYILNKHAQGFDCIATGHNMDDELQSVLMNLFQNNLELLARLGPITGIVQDKKFTKRIKPFYLHTEKSVMTYCFLKGFDLDYVECPHAHSSSRFVIRDELNNMEAKCPGSKSNLMSWFLKILPKLKGHYTTQSPIKSCRKCQASSSTGLCRACATIKKLKNIKDSK